MVFLKFVLILLLIYYALKIIGRHLLPRLFGHALKRMQKKMQDQAGQYQKEEENERMNVGGTTIQVEKKKEKKFDKNDGEYIDFEEVDDK